jgi:hypothetical protein
MSQPIQQINFEFAFSDIANKALEHIGNVIRFTQFLYHNSSSSDSYRETPLPSDEIPFIISGIKSENLSAEELKMLSINWLNQKALEEFVAGTILCLEEANKFFQFQKMAVESKTSPIASNEKAEEMKANIVKKVKKTHLPVHFEQIEKHLNCSLEFKEEILSINNARNCLVHRNGVVHEVDFNDNDNQCLRLKWTEFFNEVQLLNGEWMKLTFELREKGVDVKNLRITPIKRELCFYKDDTTVYDVNTIVGVGLTCIFFIDNLYGKVFQSIEDKSKIRFT